MESLFETTVGELIEATQARINELDKCILELHIRTVISLFEAYDLYSASSSSYTASHFVKDIRDGISLFSDKTFMHLVATYKENLEYLLSCDKEKKVTLNQTEWRHYFHGTARPE